MRPKQFTFSTKELAFWYVLISVILPQYSYGIVSFYLNVIWSSEQSKELYFEKINSNLC